MKYIFALVLATLCLNCGPAVVPASCELKSASHEQWPVVTGDVFIDPEFAAEEQGAIYQAMMDWTLATRGITKWIIRYDDPKPAIQYTGAECTHNLVIVKVKEDTPVVETLDRDCSDSEHRTLACTLVTCKVSITFVITDRLATPTYMRKVMVHEFGHFFGIDHTSGKNTSIMSPLMETAADCITSTDLMEFCNENNCRASLLNPCTPSGQAEVK